MNRLRGACRFVIACGLTRFPVPRPRFANGPVAVARSLETSGDCHLERSLAPWRFDSGRPPWFATRTRLLPRLLAARCSLSLRAARSRYPLLALATRCPLLATAARYRCSLPAASILASRALRSSQESSARRGPYAQTGGASGEGNLRRACRRSLPLLCSGGMPVQVFRIKSPS